MVKNNMKYNKEQRLEIGREIYDKQISIYDAAFKYQINYYTVRLYYRMYKAHLRKRLNNVKVEKEI